MRTCNDWQEWKFPQLVEDLENWTCRNPKPLNHKSSFEDNGVNSYRNPNECVYCKKSDHESADCQTVKTISERRKLLSEKKLCLNFTKPKHRAADCRSSKICLICKIKYRISICEYIH